MAIREEKCNRNVVLDVTKGRKRIIIPCQSLFIYTWQYKQYVHVLVPMLCSVFDNIILVLLWYCIGQNVAAGAACHRRGSRRRGLLRELQLLPVQLPLFGTPVLEPYLHLHHRPTQHDVNTFNTSVTRAIFMWCVDTLRGTLFRIQLLVWSVDHKCNRNSDECESVSVGEKWEHRPFTENATCPGAALHSSLLKFCYFCLFYNVFMCLVDISAKYWVQKEALVLWFWGFLFR